MKVRNLEEQVLKNAQDIQTLKSGIVIDYWCSGLEELGTLLTTKNVGKLAVVSVDTTKHLYLITKRIDEELIAVDMGLYPAVVTGAAGEKGETGETGKDGTGIYGCTATLPPVDSYKEGDFYILYNGDVYKKISNHWIRQTNIKGAQGPVGLNGTIVIPNPVEESTDILHKASIDGTVYKVGTDLEDIYDSLEGTESIVVDYNESETAIRIDLDQDVKDEINSKLNASKNAIATVGGLVVPNVAPIGHELVGVDNTNGQEMIGIGAGLQIKLGKLVANTVVPTGSPSILYGTDAVGVQHEYTYSSSSTTQGTIPMRNNRGDIVVPLIPYTANAAASKSYVDSQTKIEAIKDADENLRFQSGTGTIYQESAKFETLYNKFAISGNHIMFVLDFKCLANSHATPEEYAVEYDIPEWVWNKLVPRTGNYLDGIYVHPSKHGYDVQNQLYFGFYIWKHPSEHKIRIFNLGFDNENFDCYGRAVFDFILA